MSSFNKHTEVIDKSYISEEYQLYITVDPALKVIVACDYVMGELYQTRCGRLKKVNSDLGQTLESYFQIKLSEYGVETRESASLIYTPGE